MKLGRQNWSALHKSSFFRDSFWAVSGNGIGYFLLLLAGIIIARLLGKDIYGEYGLVKTTMFQLAAFSTFGLGYTSTKYISEYISKETAHLRSIAKAALNITTGFSLLMAILLFLFAESLANFMKEPQLAAPFRLLGIILVCRAVGMTTSGLLAGFKAFKKLGINNVVAGASLLLLATPLTYYWGVQGSLFALLISQLFLVVLNLLVVHQELKKYPSSTEKFERTLLSFSFPVAMQEFSYTISHWGVMLLLAKWASLGQIGIYSAAGQWNIIILFIPNLLGNVILSYLSGMNTKMEHQQQMVQRMLLINFLCTLIPFIVIYSFSGLISSFYGGTFHGLQAVLNVLCFAAIATCMSNVLNSYLIANGRNWLLFGLRTTRDTATVLGVLWVLRAFSPAKAALNISLVNVVIGFSYLLVLYIIYHIQTSKSCHA